MKRAALFAAICVVASSAVLDAQRGGRGRAGGPPVSPQKAAPIDLTGHWVSPIIEDWKYRMVTPAKGVFDAVPLTPEGRKVGESWDPAKDEAAGEQCRAYGAGGIMRLPGRLRVSWQDETTLKVETDTGTQTRLLRFGNPPAPTEATWQGHSVAQWNAAARNLKVVTTHLRSGYVRKNGAPYSEKATVSEVLEPERDAERRSMADGDHQGRGSAVLHPRLHDQLGFQETRGRHGLESNPLLRALVKRALQVRNYPSRWGHARRLR